MQPGSTRGCIPVLQLLKSFIWGYFNSSKSSNGIPESPQNTEKAGQMVEGAMDLSNSRTAPPQYTEKVEGTMDSSDTKTAVLSMTGLASSFLDPSLQFNTATIEENVYK